MKVRACDLALSPADLVGFHVDACFSMITALRHLCATLPAYNFI